MGGFDFASFDGSGPLTSSRRRERTERSSTRDSQEEDSNSDFVLRRYRFDAQGGGQETRLPALRHYDVKMRRSSAAPSESELQYHMTTNRDYLRFYYTDYLGSPPMEDSKPKFADDRGEAIEIQELCRWISSVNPRTRLESYPLFVLCKDVLNRIATKELKIIDSDKAELMDLLADAKNRIAELEKKLADAQDEFREELDGLNKKWKQRLLDSTAETPRDDGELKLLREQLAASKNELCQREGELQECKEQLEKFTKELAKQKKEASSMKSQNTSLSEKIASMEQQLKALKSGDQQDPFLKLDDNVQTCLLALFVSSQTFLLQGKIDALKRLLLDDSLFKQAKFKNVLVDTLLVPPTKGIPVSIKKALCLRLLSFIFESEQGAGDDLTKLAIISNMLSSEEKPIMISQLLKEAVEKDLPKMKLNEQAFILSSHKSCDDKELMAEWGKGKDQISLQELQPAMNQIGIPSIRSEQFFIDCSGDEWERVKIRCMEEEESQWDYMVKKDERTAAVWDLMRRFIERDFLDLTERHHPPKSGTLLHSIDDRTSCKWMLRTIGRLFGGNHDTILAFFGHFVSTESLYLSLKTDSESRQLRKRLLRYITCIVRAEKLPFSEWAFEVHACEAEETRNEKYEHIGQIYEAKVLIDETFDKTGKPREPLPEFLKNFLIRQYGLKSIALKNLANIAAGVRKEFEKALRLKIFGKITGMIDQEEYEDGLCDALMQGLKNIFPPDQIKERMDDGNISIPLLSIASATLSVFSSKYYYTDTDVVVIVFIIIVYTIIVFTENIASRLFSSQVYKDSKLNAEKFFETLYNEFDANQDHVLDFNEFTNLVRSVQPKLDDHEVLELYNQALDLTGEGDSISLDAFVYVACLNHTLETFQIFHNHPLSQQ
ncbi:hypothetical protein GUITHDRAFT_102054 [Guillardia theta CCMP2712]|uniref:EF-hand domain-containing protein n=1 Tax=Guillardia theta (strain CCMP2712) TaxID=905079 RepID=L1JVM7_GUITC|nr:hypothetical protein GUITHDRAFT_102054 [Guillardia theta CCMP2712]EKX52153.1 hypothetical protein GUITHDRAFT_102054 [Guillardia theta CCMP2712]|eukprot:XP_005839133.1 hypothetical protein GUITHDRAFT_102054 [Guillardia theta CCMP2712]